MLVLHSTLLSDCYLTLSVREADVSAHKTYHCVPEAATLALKGIPLKNSEKKLFNSLDLGFNITHEP